MLSKSRSILNRCCRLMSTSTKIKTTDPEQIKRFNELAIEWWTLDGPIKPLHLFNKCRIPWIQNSLYAVGAIQQETASAPLEGLSVLEVGCGGGILSEGLSFLGCDVTGLDASEDLITVAKMHAEPQNLSNLQYVCSTIEKYAIPNKEKYDVVVSSEVIEHVAEKEEFVKYCIQCLKPGGSIFMTTPNKTWFSWFYMIILLEDVFKIIPKGVHSYDMFIHHSDLQKLFKKNKCETIFTSGLYYNPYRNKWNLIKNKSAGYVIHAVKQP